MSWVNVLEKVAKAAGVGVVAVTALPFFGAVGAITATGVAVGALVGGTLGAVDEINENRKRKKSDTEPS